MKKIAVFAMDIEDWFHLDYFDEATCDCSYRMLDGLDVYREIIERNGIKSSFFCVGEIVKSLQANLRELADAGHDVGSHTFSHSRPLTLSIDEFVEELRISKDVVEQATGQVVEGFRAPCFSLDRERLDCVRNAGFLYDSSRIEFGDHPLYGTLDMSEYDSPRPWVFRQGDFFEFQVSTQTVLGKQIPVSGGGYLRIFPWWLMKSLLKRYLKNQMVYTLYIHPFELSRKPPPGVPEGTSKGTNLRFKLGLGRTEKKLTRLIKMLRNHEFEFMTFSEFRQSLLGESINE